MHACDISGTVGVLSIMMRMQRTVMHDHDMSAEATSTDTAAEEVYSITQWKTLARWRCIRRMNVFPLRAAVTPFYQSARNAFGHSAL
jgi:hypothetical protein